MNDQSQHLKCRMFIRCGITHRSRKMADVLAELASYGSVSIRACYGNGKRHARFVGKGFCTNTRYSRFQQFDLIKGVKTPQTCRWRIDATMDVAFQVCRWMSFACNHTGLYFTPQ